MGVYSKNSFVRKFQRKFFRQFFERRYVSSFYEDSAPGEPNGKKILMYVALPYTYITPYEVLIYKALCHQGYDVKYYIYDESVKIHELTTHKYDEINRAKFIKENCNLGRNFLSAASVDYDTIPALPARFSNAIEGVNDLEALFGYELDGHKIGKIVKRVMFRYYQSTEIPNTSTAVTIGKEFLKTILTNYSNANTLCDDFKPDIILFSHGIYCSWEIVAEICKEKGIDFVCYDRAKTRSAMNFNWNQEAPNWSFAVAWHRYLDKELSETQNKRVEHYIKERELQLNDVFSYNFKPKETDLESLRNKLGISPDLTVVTFFTNLIWDAANDGRDEIFPSFASAISNTVKRFDNRNDVIFLVRPHPAEKVLGTNQKYSDVLAGLGKRICLIDEALEVNSFSILDITDIAVTHTSTIGLEMAMTGKPSIVLGKTHYRGLGFTLDPATSEEYFKVLEELFGNCAEQSKRKALAKKYFYMMMFLYQKHTGLTHEGNSFISYPNSSFRELMQEDATINEILFELRSGRRESFVNWK